MQIKIESTATRVPCKDEFISWLQGELDRRNWSLGEAGRQAGIGKNVLHYWLNGTDPNFPSILKLAETFHVDPLEICRKLLNRYR